MKRKATPSFWDADAAPSRLHEELHVALGALEELGPAYEPQVRDALLERLNRRNLTHGALQRESVAPGAARAPTERWWRER